MYRFHLLAFVPLCYMSTLFGVVLLEPTSWDRNAPLAPIKRNPLCTSFSRGEGSSIKPMHGTLIVTIKSRPETHLQQAVVDRDQTLVRQLLDGKEDPNVQNHHGFTALHFAAALGYTDLVALLLSKKADPNIQDDFARATPLHVAFTDNNPEIIELLVKHGADVTIPDIYGYTPLHSAAAGNAVEMANILLQAGTDINAATFEETEARMRCSSMLKLTTPLHEAAMHGHVEMVQFLIQNGARIDARLSTKETLLQIAIRENHHELAEFLKSLEAQKEPEESVIETKEVLHEQVAKAQIEVPLVDAEPAVIASPVVESASLETKEVSDEPVTQAQMEAPVVNAKPMVIESPAAKPTKTSRDLFLTNCYNLWKYNPGMCIILGVLIAYGIKNAAQYCGSIA
jgi:hypothetical protein